MDPTKRYNFSNCPIGRSTYQGANGSKISIMIDGAEYMLKQYEVTSDLQNRGFGNTIVKN